MIKEVTFSRSSRQEFTNIQNPDREKLDNLGHVAVHTRNVKLRQKYYLHKVLLIKNKMKKNK